MRRVSVRIGLVGREVLVDPRPLQTLLEATALDSLDSDPDVGLMLGSPGAYQKVTAVLAVEEKPAAFCKIADRELAAERIVTEANVLLELAGTGIRGLVPGVINLVRDNGTAVLGLRAGPTMRGPFRLNETHIQFIKSLSDATASRAVGSELPVFQKLLAGRETIQRTLSPQAAEGASRALDRVFQRLGAEVMPVSRAHGDFAPWNTKLTGDGELFVLDWEASTPGMMPMFDLIHFEMVLSAVNGRRPRLENSPVVTAALELLWPNGTGHLGDLREAAWLWTTLVYAQARERFQQQRPGPVWRWLEKVWSARAIAQNA